MPLSCCYAAALSLSALSITGMTSPLSQSNEYRLKEKNEMKCMKIYVAGPYTGESIEQIEMNVERAMEAGLKIWKKGHYPYIPHLTHWPDILSRELGIEMDWADYMRWHAPWVDSCDALFLLAESKGALLELQRAIEEKKIVFKSLDEIPEVSRSRTWVDVHVD